ncbi:DUF317 domain-containing protein [Streptomyces sp. NBC_00690]|uniref:DUF317 domain-containing protein n=1 Tax=Streptomyces sp. NBC_00690 TaxID=2975808 RepID=UPI002E2B4C45|nr:DUF317 domain-containing protein [Streptomyces sp. NBC_00690]
MSVQKPLDPSEPVHLSPRYLAASPPAEHRQHVVDLAQAHGWSLDTGPYTSTATSPCEKITIRHDRAAEGLGPHLTISARTGPGAPDRWRADVAGATPVEFLTSLTATIAHGLQADADHLIYGIGDGGEPDLFELHLDERWEMTDGLGLVGFQSVDGLAALMGRPPGSGGPPLQGDENIVWHAFAVTPALGPMWGISFTYETPPFVVNAVLNQVLSPEPLVRPAALARHPDLAHLVTAHPITPAAGQPPRSGPGLPPQMPGSPHQPRTR